jgi:hypothetical protein
LEDFPAEILQNGNRTHALLFKDLATLRQDIPLFKDVDQLKVQITSKDLRAAVKSLSKQ